MKPSTDAGSPADAEPLGPVDELPAIKTPPRQLPPIAASQRPPRLGAGHLLLWIGCCGVYLAIVRASSPAAAPGALGMFVVVLLSLATGAAWTGMFVFASRRVRRVRWTIEPGEWLVAVLGCQAAIGVLIWQMPGGNGVFSDRSSAVAALTSFLFIAPALGRRLPRHWTVVFGVLLAANALQLAMLLAGFAWLSSRSGERIAQGYFQVGYPLTLLAAVACGVVGDARRRLRRSWLHWLGIELWFWLVASPWLLPQ